MPNTQNTSNLPNELFRYVRLRRPVVLDLESRVQRSPELRAILAASEEEQQQWAEHHKSGKERVTGLESLSFNYRAHLTIESLPEMLLPDKRVLRNPAKFRQLRLTKDRAYQADRKNCLNTLIAHRIAGDAHAESELARLLDFIEAFPKLYRINRPRRYATPVMKRTRFKVPTRNPSNTTDAASNEQASKDLKQRRELRELNQAIDFLWRARTAEVTELRRQLRQKVTALATPTPAEDSPTSAAPEFLTKADAKSRENRQRELEQRLLLRRQHAEETRAALVEAHDVYRDRVERFPALGELSQLDDAFYQRAVGRSKAELVAMQEKVGKLGTAYEIETQHFCQAAKAIGARDDLIQEQPAEIGSPTHFLEHPSITFTDTIQLLGNADLITVTEIFVRYTPGEISYIENILPGELRRRKVKSTRYFEQAEETVTQESTDTSSETSAKATSEINSEIESELNTRFNTDVNASLNASGGGSIGVVDLEGGAALSAGLGVGIDTSLSTANESKFAQEIVNKAVERVKQSTMRKRLSRSYSLFETTNLHQIDNTDSQAKNGVYCFLDKHVCISETIYGKRTFMLADVLVPGKNLACEQLERRRLALESRGEKPEFDITPSDVQPSTYKALVGRFRAGGMEPPPPAVMTLGRTYKTDTTNTNVEQQDFNMKKVADVLVPFFERYKRFTITDNIKLPEGYQVQDVWVTVNHGANGVSIPAHLPFAVTGATLFSTPALVSAMFFPMLYAPYALWQVAYMASPLLHYNADSSNVTVCIGNESQDSPYWFFQPELLVQQVFDLLGTFSSIGPDFLTTVQNLADNFFEEIGDTHIPNVSSEVGELIDDTVSDLIKKLKAVFDAIVAVFTSAQWPDFSNDNPISTALDDLIATVKIENLQTQLGELFVPLKSFVDSVLNLLLENLSSAISDLFSWMSAMFENSDKLAFGQAHGLTKELPISFNAIAVKPGVTINLNACLRRTDEALDQWRLDTYNKLYQGYLQQMAEWESRSFISGDPSALRKSPGTLRQEEHRAVKELVLHSLNNYHGSNDNQYDLARIQLFESGIDWDNMSYRLFNYGPSASDVERDKQGWFIGVDNRRKAFLKALWAQVLIPLQGNEHLEAQILEYFASGDTELQEELSDDELAALFQDLVLDREAVDSGQLMSHETKAIPTDLIVLKTTDLESQLPQNPNTPCGLPEE